MGCSPDLIVLDLSMPLMNGSMLLVCCNVCCRSPHLVQCVRRRPSKEQVKLIGISAIVSKSDQATVLLEKARALVYRIAA